FPFAADVVAPPLSLCGVPTVVALLADGDVPVGTVEVVNDDADLYVTYRTDASWPIAKTALYVGASVEGIPLSGGGNPQIGRFPWKATHRSAPRVVSWRVPLADAGADVAAIAAFAEVGDAPEGAWGAGSPISNGGSWATWFMHAIQDCDAVIDPN